MNSYMLKSVIALRHFLPKNVRGFKNLLFKQHFLSYWFPTLINLVFASFSLIFGALKRKADKTLVEYQMEYYQNYTVYISRKLRWRWEGGGCKKISFIIWVSYEIRTESRTFLNKKNCWKTRKFK